MKMKVYSLAAILRGGQFGPQWQCAASISVAPEHFTKEQVFESYARDQALKNPGIEFASTIYVDELTVAELEKYLFIAKGSTKVPEPANN